MATTTTTTNLQVPYESSSSTLKIEYDVFLSFRGEDTRYGFVAHLYKELHQKGVKAFIDSEDLKKGEKIGNLLKYIERSRIFVPVFSKRYAESRWCLMEISKIAKCRRKILPVFYDINPSDVRRQRGSFEEAFLKHMDQESIDDIKEWKEALKKTGEISGYDLTNPKSRSEAQIIDDVTKDVLKILKDRTFLQVAEYPVGLTSRLKDLMEKLSIEVNDVRFIGIHGIGGIGKTTIAMALYNELYLGFEHACFIANIRGRLQSQDGSGLVLLQKQVIQSLFNETDPQIADVAHGTSVIKERIHGKKVLVVLDDVDDVTQVTSLVGNRNQFHTGSRIIFTTRDRLVLLQYGVTDESIYVPPLLDEERSLELFSHFAFPGFQLTDEYVHLAKQTIKAHSGLPLLLEVIGREFVQLDKQLWESKSQRLKKVQPRRVYERLKLTYDGLEDIEKQIFLDVACFLVGKDGKYANYMWEDCDFSPKISLKNLEHKSLLKINKHGEFEMHDAIREMGRQIVKQEFPDPGSWSRLWDLNDVIDTFANLKGSNKIEAVALDSKITEVKKTLRCEAFRSLCNLRMLHINCVYLEGDFKDIPATLKWLRWSRCPLEALPDELNLDKAVVIDLYASEITHLQDEHLRVKVYGRLEVLDLSHCQKLVTSPDFSKMKQLERLVLEGCYRLNELHSSIEILKKLTFLSLKMCKALHQLPDEFCKLSSLEFLDLSYCSGLVATPNFTNMTKLKKLMLEHCTSLEEIGRSIGCLVSLAELNMRGCSMLYSLPEDVSKLTSLRMLDLSDCRNLSSLPQLSNMTSLTEVHLDNVVSLRELCLESSDLPCETEIPDSAKLTKLWQLSLYKCPLETVPDSIGKLLSLKELVLDETKIVQLPDSIGYLKNLLKLSLISCRSLKGLPESLGNLESLEELELDNTRLEKLPSSIGMLGRLKILSLRHCSRIRSLHQESQLPSSLQKLLAEGCTALEENLHISNLKGLVYLDLKGCQYLADIEGLEELEFLEYLHLVGCTNLNSGFMTRLHEGRYGAMKEFMISGRPVEEDHGRLHFVLPNIPKTDCKAAEVKFHVEASEVRVEVTSHDEVIYESDLPVGFRQRSVLGSFGYNHICNNGHPILPYLVSDRVNLFISKAEEASSSDCVQPLKGEITVYYHPI